MKITDVLWHLGAKYCIKIIDFELVIYRDLGDYDIEVSGLSDRKRKIKCTIFVWCKNPLYIVESIEVNSLQELENTLDEVSSRYYNFKQH